MASLVWFRNDLRIQDNPALHAAMNRNEPILCLYIYDPEIGAAQNWWLHHSLNKLLRSLENIGLSLCLKKGEPQEIILDLAKKHPINTLCFNRQYEPKQFKKDKEIYTLMKDQGIEVQTFNGAMLKEPWEVKNLQGEYYKVFTQYWKKHQSLDTPRPPIFIETNKRYASILEDSDELEVWNLLPQNPNWASGFEEEWEPGESSAQKKLNRFIKEAISSYKSQRDFPAINGTSKLSPHLHFGEISPYQIWHQVQAMMAENPSVAEPFLRQLGWREFCMSILYYNEDIITQPFRKEFSAFQWEKNDALFNLWKKGKTGYPIVDAAMKQLWHTGWMHNRLRMIVASFLTKDLLINWTEGKSWFRYTLLDADLANNVCGWQWVAGCGTDAQPYFRIFNPILQSKKFDPHGEFIRKWLPELKNLDSNEIHSPWEVSTERLQEAGIVLGEHYPKPIVDHSIQKNLALKLYQGIK